MRWRSISSKAVAQLSVFARTSDWYPRIVRHHKRSSIAITMTTLALITSGCGSHSSNAASGTTTTAAVAVTTRPVPQPSNTLEVAAENATFSGADLPQWTADGMPKPNDDRTDESAIISCVGDKIAYQYAVADAIGPRLVSPLVGGKQLAVTTRVRVSELTSDVQRNAAAFGSREKFEQCTDTVLGADFQRQKDTATAQRGALSTQTYRATVQNIAAPDGSVDTSGYRIVWNKFQTGQPASSYIDSFMFSLDRAEIYLSVSSEVQPPDHPTEVALLRLLKTQARSALDMGTAGRNQTPSTPGQTPGSSVPAAPSNTGRGRIA